MGDVTRVAKEAIEGHRVVRVFNAQDYEHDAPSRRSTSLIATATCGLINAKSTSNPVVQLIASVALAVVMYFAIRQVLSHAMRLCGLCLLP